MPDSLPPDVPPTDGNVTATPAPENNPREQLLNIESELKDSYLSYAMSVIVSRALPDVRDGLKPSQRRILVAMNDLNLGPASSRMKCAKITGQTTGDYHPHGTMAVYDTLVRMAQDWVMRHVLIDKQGNFGSLAGLPPAAERYTEARLSHFAAEMLADLDKDTVDMVPNYDGRVKEPMVLPSRFPNLLVNGSGGIAVGMATSIPPHNLSEVCSATIHLIDHPSATIDDLIQHIPGPDFPTGGVICGRQGIYDGYRTGRGKVIIRARAKVDEEGSRSQIIISDIPYQQTRNRIMELIGEAIKNERITGISGAPRDESSERKGEPVRIVCDIKRDADPHLVLNQLYQFTPLQETFSIILLALVDGRPKTLNLKQMLEEYLRHRVRVIRRRTEYLLRQAKHRAHILEGQLIAIASIDEVIAICRAAPSRAEAKNRLVALEVSAAVMQRALGKEHFDALIKEVGPKTSFSMTEEQAEAVVRLQLGQLAALERDEIFKEYASLRAKINEYETLLSDQKNILAVVRKDLHEISEKYGNERRTQIIDEGPSQMRHEDLIEEEMNVVTISHNGYIKRLPSNTYRSQKRGGRGVSGGQTRDDDFVEHFFTASTHAYLLFFTNFGQVYWLKVYDIPQMSRTSAGRALPNVISLKPEEKVSAVIPVRRFEPNQYLLIATRRGLVKKTALEQYSRPRAGGIIGINLEEGDSLINAVLVGEGDEVVLATKNGMAIRFSESDARPMGRDTKGVKGINLGKDDEVVGLAVADPEGQLLTVCQNGYGKRTSFGPSEASGSTATGDEEPVENSEPNESEGDENSPSNMRYRTQRRGGKGLKDIRTSERNGPVVSTVAVREGDELMVITQQGMVTRMKVSDFRSIGRNTQGVRLANLQEGDRVVTAVKLAELDNIEEITAESTEPTKDA
ncbi:MAG: DNA gyrase subunit A [Planctomycetia bacterium]|nr:DNA gyrase subunit A [Planctomycetia bacterium]